MRRRAQRKPPQAASAARDPWLLTLVLVLLILAASIGPYMRTLDYGLVWDDLFLIGPHLDVRSATDLAALVTLPFDALLKDEPLGRTYFRPAVLLSFALDRAASDDVARDLHRTNVVLYGLACLFLWLFVRELTGHPILAAAGTVLYALHPTHPETVAFVSGRTDLMAGLFLFAALWAAARLGPRIRRPDWKLLPAALLLIPALFSKEIALTASILLPAVLALRAPDLKRAELLRAAIPVVAVDALYVVARFGALGADALPATPAVAPVQGAVPQLLTSAAVVARYVPLALAPVGLSARHEIAAAHRPDALVVAGGIVLALLLLGFAVAAFRRSPWMIPLGLTATTLLPACYVRVLSGALVAERFLFVPTASIAIGIALLPRLARRRRGTDRPNASWGLLVPVAACAIWFWLLLQPRVAIWRDEGTLFGSMLRDSPGSPHVHGILGTYYYKRRDLELAAFHYGQSHRLFPASDEMLLNLGATYDELGKTDSAFIYVRALTARSPGYAGGWYGLGNLYVRVDEPDSARMAFERALRADPSFAAAENNLGAVMERMGRPDEALAHYRRALAIDPGFREATNNLTRLSAESGAPRAAPAGGRP